jgi:hypothetical protein
VGRKMKKLIFLLIFVSLFANPLWGDEDSSWLGEKLSYVVKYMGVKIGTLTMEVKRILEFNGRLVYHIISEVRSSPPLSLFFRVNDRIESYFDIEKLRSLRYIKNLHEGSFIKNEEVIFDYNSCTAIYPTGVIPIPQEVQDPLSALYYLRTRSLRVGDSLIIPTNSNKKNFSLEVKTLRRERIKTPFGTHSTVVVESLPKLGGLFHHRGRMKIWLTDDERKIPVLIKSSTPIGVITAILISRMS